MSGTKGYRSYRGRMPKGRIALMVILILVIVVSAAVIWLQNYVVYTADGQIRLELPWQREETPPAEEETLPEEDVEVIVQEPEGPPQVTALFLEAAPLTQVAWESTQAAFSGTAASTIRSRIRSGAWRTTSSTASRSHLPAPQTIVSRMCVSK